MSSFPIEAVRARFPALAVADAGVARLYLDAPGGTQACASAIASMAVHLRDGTANAGGAFATSVEVDALSAAAHVVMAELLGGQADEIAFGPNMTSLTFAVSRALARGWRAGDELVVTRLDHDANVAPWLQAAADRGMTVRWLDFDPATGAWAPDDLASLVNERTRVVALGAASNALGTINPIAEAAAIVKARSDALVFVDAVQSVPHLPTDVIALGCDLLVCSPYKFFGPHQGVLWGRAEVIERLEAYKVRPAGDEGAHRFETGTPSFEAQAGVIGTIAYLDWLGGELAPGANDRRSRLMSAMTSIQGYEAALGEQLLAGVRDVPGLQLWGPPTMAGRVPTFAFTLAGHTPQQVARALGQRGIFAWAGHFYAVETVARLGLAEAGGLVRVGLCHYNTAAEVDRLLAALREIA